MQTSRPLTSQLPQILNYYIDIDIELELHGLQILEKLEVALLSDIGRKIENAPKFSGEDL